MSLLGDAQQFIKEQKYAKSPQVPPRGGAPRPQPSYITGALEAPGGYQSQNVSQQYTGALQERAERAAGILSAPALTTPMNESIPQPSDMEETKQALGMTGTGVKIAKGVVGAVDSLAGTDIGKSIVGTGIDAASGALGVAGAGMSVYNIAQGKGKVGDYVNIGSQVASPVASGVTQLANLSNLGSLGMESIGASTASGATAGTSSIGSAAGGLSALGSAVMIAAPYYALAKAGGMVINAITANNPELRNTPLGHLGGSLEEPLAVERYWSSQLAQKGVGSERLHETANLINPLEVGSFIFQGDKINKSNLKNWIHTVAEKSAALGSGFLTGGLSNVDAVVKSLMSEKQAEKIERAQYAASTLGLSELSKKLTGSSTAGRVNAALLTGGLSEVFCFAAGTPITMEDGTIKPVEQVDLFDSCKIGGIVNGKGVVLSEELYDYRGVNVTGSHAVYEDGKWIRVKDSILSIKLQLDDTVKVYIVNNVDHVLLVNDIIFADYGEVTNSENMTADERLEYLNAHCRI